MKKSYRTLEFSFIQDYIKNYCFSEMAKKRIDQIQPFQDIDDLKLYQDDISSAMKIIYAYGRIPLAPYEDIKEILQKAQKGGVCYPQDLLKIVQILKNVQEVQAYLDQEIEQSHLLEIFSLLYLPKDLYNEILKCVDPSGNIYDHASHELYRLRRQISAIEASMRKKIEALRAQNKDYLSHDVISTRNDHFVLPVNVSYKTQIKGIHHGHSSSGRTTYVEPEEIVSYNNQLSQIKQDEQLEIHRILLELTKKVRSYDRVLNEDLEIDAGEFFIEDSGKQRKMEAEDIGYVLSTPNVPEFLTAREFLKFFIDINKKRIKNERTIDEYFDFMKIEEEDRDRLLKDYSHGMKNKMQMLVNIIANPNVLLLDEPLTSFDVVVAEEMKQMLKEIKKDHIIIFSTHIMELALDLCDDIVILNKGILEEINKNNLDNEHLKDKIIDALREEN